MTPDQPVVFIHGLWLHASSWSPWMELFSAAGHHTEAPGWPGEPDSVEQARENPESVADHGITDAVEHFTASITALGTPPIIIGHAFGGMIARTLLDQGLATAAIAIDAHPIEADLPDRLAAPISTLPFLLNPANRHRAVSLTVEQFRHVFGDAVSAQESAALFDRWSIPAPAKPLFDAAANDFDPHPAAATDVEDLVHRPLLLITGGTDHAVPKGTLRHRHRPPGAVTDLLQFSDRGRSLTIDGGWRGVADAAFTWLHEQAF